MWLVYAKDNKQSSVTLTREHLIQKKKSSRKPPVEVLKANPVWI